MNTHSTNTDSRLPQPGTVYSIPANTHADLDLQDDKEVIFYQRNTSRSSFSYYRMRR